MKAQNAVTLAPHIGRSDNKAETKVRHDTKYVSKSPERGTLICVKFRVSYDSTKSTMNR